eukprot:m.416488 g.416488  ORF g.416488 m.416488 type:complete len:149 (+) comp29995_c0_seq1:54-500(+)
MSHRYLLYNLEPSTDEFRDMASIMGGLRGRCAAAAVRMVQQSRAGINSAGGVRVAAQPSRCYATSIKKSPSEASMEAKLVELLQATEVNVEDQSGGCGSAFLVECESPKFAGLSKIKQHRMVTTALADEVADMHSIRVFTATPSSTAE